MASIGTNKVSKIKDKGKSNTAKGAKDIMAVSRLAQSSYQVHCTPSLIILASAAMPG